MIVFDLMFFIVIQIEVLVVGFSSEECCVLLQYGIEVLFCGVFFDNKCEGVYCCWLCVLLLFCFSIKFDFGIGWFSFFVLFDLVYVCEICDISYGMVCIEIICVCCGSYLGYVFLDGLLFIYECYCLNFVLFLFIVNGEFWFDFLQCGGVESGVVD